MFTNSRLGSEVQQRARRRPLWIAVLVFLLHPALSFAQLNQNCTVSILNRTAQVDANGNWLVPNIPVGFGPVRAHAVCTQNGQTTFGKTGAFLINNNQTTGYDASIQLGPTDLTPSSIAIAASPSVLSQSGATTQLTVTATYPSGTTANVTAANTGTSYQTSNPNIVTVSQDGLVRAIGTGTALVTAVQDGATAIFSIRVIPSTDTDGDGIPDAAEIQLGLNPNNPVDALEDPDGDGLTNLDEYRLGTDIRNPDTDGDGIPDGIEVKLGLDPLSPNPTTTVQGRVLSSGNPVAGATVVVFGLFTASTDGTGAFSLRFVPAGLGNLTATAQFLGGPILSGVSGSVPPVAAGITDLGAIPLAGNSGSVTGIVTNPQGQFVVGAQVSIASGFMTAGATTDAAGRYTVSLLAGSVTATAFDAATGLRARGVGTLAPGTTLTINLQLAATGSVGGTVFRTSGQMPAARVPVTLSSAGAPASTVTDAFGRYSFDTVVAGAVTVEVSDPATGDRGRATGALAGNGTTQTLNVTFNGVGGVVVTVRTGSSPLANAPVTLTSQTQFGGSQSATTQADGTATFNQVLAGSFSATATNPANNQTGSTTGIALAGATTSATITFQAGAGTGSITGRVFQTDGVTPVAGETVRLLISMARCASRPPAPPMAVSVSATWP